MLIWELKFHHTVRCCWSVSSFWLEMFPNKEGWGGLSGFDVEAPSIDKSSTNKIGNILLPKSWQGSAACRRITSYTQKRLLNLYHRTVLVFFLKAIMSFLSFTWPTIDNIFRGEILFQEGSNTKLILSWRLPKVLFQRLTLSSY